MLGLRFAAGRDGLLALGGEGFDGGAAGEALVGGLRLQFCITPSGRRGRRVSESSLAGPTFEADVARGEVVLSGWRWLGRYWDERQSSSNAQRVSRVTSQAPTYSGSCSREWCDALFGLRKGQGSRQKLK